MRISIAGIPKEHILIALFNNVNNKSKESRKTRNNIADGEILYNEKVPVGTFSQPTEQEIRTILAERRGYVDFIGAVEFRIDFSDDEIDVTFYDEHHNTGSKSIMTAAVCVANAKLAYEASEQKLKASNTVTTALEEHFGVEDINLIELIPYDNPKLLLKMLKEHLSEEHLRLVEHGPRNVTILSIPTNQYAIKFAIPGTLCDIAKLLASPERLSFLDAAKRQYEALFAKNKREAATLESVANVLKEHLGIEHLILFNYEACTYTAVSIEMNYYRIQFSLPGKIFFIKDILSSSDRIAYLDHVKKQYEGEKARAEASLQLITSSLQECFGVQELKIDNRPSTNHLRISVGTNASTINFLLPGELSEVASILSSPERITYLERAKTIYHTKKVLVEKEQRVASLRESDFLFFQGSDSTPAGNNPVTPICVM
jgi:hypothetical protein